MVEISRAADHSDGCSVACQVRALDLLQEPSLAHACLSFDEDAAAFPSTYKIGYLLVDLMNTDRWILTFMICCLLELGLQPCQGIPALIIKAVHKIMSVIFLVNRAYPG